MTTSRTYCFTITVTVESDQKGYDDPEWIADAARGTLANEYGYGCSFAGIGEVVDTTGLP